MDLSNPLIRLAITAGALWAIHKYGPGWAKGLALGAAGTIALNQLPVIRDGQTVRLVA
jgi:hypothetical protein